MRNRRKALADGLFLGLRDFFIVSVGFLAGQYIDLERRSSVTTGLLCGVMGAVGAALVWWLVLIWKEKR